MLSPIFWYEPRAMAALEPDPVRKLASLGGLEPAAACARVIPSWRRELLRLADLILPNSRSEAAQLVRFFGVRARAYPGRSQRSDSLVRPGVGRAFSRPLRTCSIRAVRRAESSRARTRWG